MKYKFETLATYDLGFPPGVDSSFSERWKKGVVNGEEVDVPDLEHPFDVVPDGFGSEMDPSHMTEQDGIRTIEQLVNEYTVQGQINQDWQRAAYPAQDAPLVPFKVWRTPTEAADAARLVNERFLAFRAARQADEDAKAAAAAADAEKAKQRLDADLAELAERRMEEKLRAKASQPQ